MNHGGDVAEQMVRLSLEGFEVVAKLTGSATKNLALILFATLKQEQQTKGKARLTNMIKSGKELKVFSIQNRDLNKFTKEAKRYGVLYCVLRDKTNKGDTVPVDIIARAEDASKIQRIVERFELAKVDKASIVGKVKNQKYIKEKSQNEVVMEQAVASPNNENPYFAKTDKSPLSRQDLEGACLQSDKKLSVKEKIENLKAKYKAENLISKVKNKSKER